MENEVIRALVKKVESESYARKLGMRLVSLEPGHAVVEMAPKKDMMNIFDMTHGGAIFSLMDEAFQVSCNSHGTVAVALSMTVNYHHPPKGEGRLRAESKEIHRTKRTATYEIKVTDEQQTLIASCLAMAYRKEERLPFLKEEM